MPATWQRMSTVNILQNACPLQASRNNLNQYKVSMIERTLFFFCDNYILTHVLFPIRCVNVYHTGGFPCDSEKNYVTTEPIVVSNLEALPPNLSTAWEATIWGISTNVSNQFGQLFLLFHLPPSFEVKLSCSRPHLMVTLWRLYVEWHLG